MKPIQIISQDLFDKVRSRFSNLEMGDETGAVTIDPAEARFFDFDFVREGVDLGRVSISLNDLGSLKVYYSQGITEGQDIIGKKLWYDFLKEMRYFAMRRLLRFDTRDIAKTNLDKNDFQHLAATQGPKEEDMANIAEGRWNGRSSSKTSRAVKGRTEVIIRHNKPVEETFPGARSQRKNIKAIFIQNRDGERFKYPFIHPAGAFAMAQHVDHGGAPHDPAGKAIIRMSEEIAQLAEFQKTIRGATLHDDALGITERAVGRLQELKAQIESLSKRPHYESWISEFTATEDDGLQAELDAVTMEDYKAKFTQKNYQEELSQYFPLLHRIMSEANKVDLESYVSETDQDQDYEQAQESVSETIPPGKLDQAFAEWAEDAASMEFDAAKLAQALQELPQPLTLSDEMAADEVVRFFSEYGVESPELSDNLKDQARINPSADPIKDVIMPWAMKPENQEKFPGLSELFQSMAQPAPEQPAEPAPEQQPVAEDRDMKAMIGEVARIVKSFYNRDNPNVGPFRSEEGIAIDVEKAISEKFGDEMGQQARQLAEKFMTKLTQEWSQRHRGDRLMGEKDNEGDPHSHQAQTTLKHLKNKTYGDRADAANIKPGVKGFKDRYDMLQRAKAMGNLKGDEGVAEGSEKNKAYTQGSEAGKKSHRAENNPYKSGSPEHREWESGRKGTVPDRSRFLPSKKGVAEGGLEEIDRRGFLKGIGAAAVTGAAPASAATWQNKDLKDPMTDKPDGKWNEIKSDNNNAKLIIHEYPGPDHLNDPKKTIIYTELKFIVPGQILDFKYIPSNRESFAIGRIKIGQNVEDFYLSKDKNLSIGWTSSKNILSKLSKYTGPLKIEMPIYNKGKVIFDFTLENTPEKISSKIKEQGVAEGSDKLQGTPVVSLSDFSDKDDKKDKYGRTVPKKLKKDDPRVKFHKDEKKGVAEGEDYRTDNMVSHISQIIRGIYPRAGDKNEYMKFVAQEMPRIVQSNPKLFRRAFGIAYDRFFHIDQDDDNDDYTDYSMRQGERGMEENINGIELNGKMVDSSTLEVDGVDPGDHPDYVDAYFSSGEYTDGTPLSDEDLAQLTDLHGDLVNQIAHGSYQGGMDADDQALEAMSRHAKGWAKYGPGMKELAKAGKAGASEKEMDKIRDKHDRYDEEVDMIRKLAGMAK